MNMINQSPNRERVKRETDDAIWIRQIQIDAMEAKPWLSVRELGTLARLKREKALFEKDLKELGCPMTGGSA